MGKAARSRVPRSTLEGWRPAVDRPDPVTLLAAQNASRRRGLVPVRHGRMMVSPFAFFRGAAKIMSSDLSRVPRTGLEVQLCGDAHLANFGIYASPERALLFDLNDFDETLPGPFEIDVARLAASVVVASRENAHSRADARAAATIAVESYRDAMTSFAEQRTLDVWYARVDAEAVLREFIASGATKRAADTRRSLAKVRTRDSIDALAKLTEVVGGERRIVHAPPLIVPIRELTKSLGRSAQANEALVRSALRGYARSLPPYRRRLLERFELVDVALKVVGVGSVGTYAWIAFFQGRDEHDPLFLQCKEATRSVLEDYLPKSRFREPGERVVQGQLAMQAASDIFLGWCKPHAQGRSYYWRQLRDMKGAAAVETFGPNRMAWYAALCGWTLARAHARSGDAVAIASYLGKNDRFDRALTVLAERYADQNDRDHDVFVRAIRSGRVEALGGL